MLSKLPQVLKRGSLVPVGYSPAGLAMADWQACSSSSDKRDSDVPPGWRSSSALEGISPRRTHPGFEQG